MDSNLKRSIILENYSNPFHKGLVNDESYIKINARNESCIDNLDMMIKIEDGIIKDICFDGEACAISTSATSIINKLMINKSVLDALKIMTEYEAMIDEKEYDADLLEEATVYDEIYKQPNRKKCALLPIKGLRKMLEEYTLKD